MPEYTFMTLEDYKNWRLLKDYELAKSSFKLIKELYNNPGACFNWSDMQAIEKAYFKQENRVRKFKSQCISKGLVSLQD